MTITLTAGSWLIPATMTLLSIGYAAFMSHDNHYQYVADRTVILGLWLAAFMASLAWWFIWLEYA